MSDRYTVKVQLPLASTDQHPKALIYTEDRGIEFFAPITEDLVEVMGGDVRAFFLAEIEDGDLVLKERLQGDGW